MKAKNILSLILRAVAAIIMLQTLYFKFMGAPESVYIFTAVGIEPWGRIGTGIAELIASALLLWQPTIVIGSLMGIGIMLGALLTHLFILGIVVQDDGGQLFIYALIVLLACIALLRIHSDQLIIYRNKLLSQ